MANPTETATRFSWTQAPDLMARLSDAQNGLRTPIDIMTFAGWCGSRDALERHVVHYEAQIAQQVAA